MIRKQLDWIYSSLLYDNTDGEDYRNLLLMELSLILGWLVEQEASNANVMG